MSEVVWKCLPVGYNHYTQLEYHSVAEGLTEGQRTLRTVALTLKMLGFFRFFKVVFLILVCHNSEAFFIIF